MKLKISPEVSMPLDTVTSTIALLGVRGSGKTHTSSLIAEEMLENHLHLVIIDPLDVWWGLKSSADGKHEGYPILIMGGDHGDVPLESTAGKMVAKLIVEEKISAILSMKHFSDGEACRFVADFLLEVFRLCKNPLHVLVDEADLFAPQRPMKGSSKEISLHAMDKIVRRGRASGLGVSMMTQRPAVLHKDVLTQAETLIALRILSPQDRGAVEAWVEVHGDKKEREEIIGSLHTLETGTGWVWSPNFLRLFCKTTFRERRTFDSSATPKVNSKRARVEPKKLAQVDLTKIKNMMAATIEKVKLENPTLLKRENARLQKELANAMEAATSAQTRYAMLQKVGGPTKITKIKVPAIGARSIKGLEKAYKSLMKTQRTYTDVGNRISEAVGYFRLQTDRLFAQIAAAKKSAAEPIAKVTPVFVGKPISLADARTSALNGMKKAEAGRILAAKLEDGIELGGGPRKILAVMAPDAPVDKATLGIRAGFAPNSGTFSNYLSELTSMGCIQNERGKYEIVRHPVVDAIAQTSPTREELLTMWMSKLGAERKLLAAVAELGPLNKEQIAEKCGMALSGTFSNYLSSLTSKSLVERNSDGLYEAHQVLRG
jgi:hypothetical protein